MTSRWMTQKTETFLLTTAMTVSSAALLFACSKSADSFSTLADSQTFKQSTVVVPKPIDILWVIDNSGSMSNSQTNIANNFQSFINRFQSLGYDYHMGVTTTDAYLAEPYMMNNPLYSRLRGKNPNPVYIIDKNTPNINNVFIDNIMQGTSGDGDERAFSSMKSTLLNTWTWNVAFRRPNAFLAVVIVSDEDDFSMSNSSSTTNYSNPNLHTIQSYVTWLDSFTNYQAGSSRNYSVNVVTIMDNACLTQLNNSTQRLGVRHMQLADATGGIKASLCGNFASSLDLISGSVLAMSSVFKLDREPIPSSIAITINGVSIPQDSNNGWSYDAATNSVSLHGSSIPAADADIRVNYDPANVII